MNYLALDISNAKVVSQDKKYVIMVLVAAASSILIAIWLTTRQKAYSVSRNLTPQNIWKTSSHEMGILEQVRDLYDFHPFVTMRESCL